MLAKYKINPEKLEIIDIDHRKDMDQIQAYMKKVKFKHFKIWKRNSSILRCEKEIFKYFKIRKSEIQAFQDLKKEIQVF